LNPRPPPYQLKPRAGFEPATTALPSQSSFLNAGFQEISLNWEDFERYLYGVYSNKRTARTRLNYAKRYCHCLLNRNFSELKVLTDDKRGHILKALSVLAKYLGIYQQFKQLVTDYGLKWSGKAKDKLMLERLTRVEDPNEIYGWVKNVKSMLPQLAEFMDLIAFTGMRLVEAVKSYNLIIQLAREGKLSDYYDADLNALQHYKFSDLFIRRTKKAFVSFVPKELIDRIANENKISSPNAVLKTLQRYGMHCRFGDIREAHGSILTKHLSRSEIDFLHGRIGTSVFMQHYFNPALIADLKERVSKCIKEIYQKVA